MIPITNTPLNPDALVVAYAVYAGMTAEQWRTRPPTGWREGIMEDVNLAVSAYLAAAQPEVNSVEELDQLPIGSLIMMSGVVAPFLHTDDGWESTRTPGKPVWDYTTNPSYLPARVLYRPTKEASNGR